MLDLKIVEEYKLREEMCTISTFICLIFICVLFDFELFSSLSLVCGTITQFFFFGKIQ